MNYFLEGSRAVFRDVRGSEAASDRAVGEFYCSIRRGRTGSQTIDAHVYYADLGFDAWNKVPAGKDGPADFREKARSGFRYYLTRQDPDFSKMPEVRLIGTVDGINEASGLERLIYKKKKKRPPVLKIFKYS